MITTDTTSGFNLRAKQAEMARVFRAKAGEHYSEIVAGILRKAAAGDRNARALVMKYNLKDATK